MSTKPVIGITCEYDLKKNLRVAATLYPEYFEAVEEAGGIPMLIPPLRDRRAMRDILDRVDGVILSGGDDYHPKLYGESPHHTYTPIHPRREAFDLAFAGVLLESSIPVLGICAGAQALNLVLGGSLLQDLDRQVDRSLVHKMLAPDMAIHEVVIEPRSLLNPTEARIHRQVPSQHHQALQNLGPGLQAIAFSPDGVIEAVQGKGPRHLLGVQWHPELALGYQGTIRTFHLGILRDLVQAATQYRWPS